MTKLLTVDDLEIEFAKQHKSHACKWCTYITVRSGQNTKMLMMIKTNLKPHATFTFDCASFNFDGGGNTSPT